MKNDGISAKILIFFPGIRLLPPRAGIMAIFTPTPRVAHQSLFSVLPQLNLETMEVSKRFGNSAQKMENHLV